jgi:hypothetical protein
MAKRNPEQTRAGVIAPLMMIGFGIGWLMGLSVSPVVSIVITSVIGAAAALVAALSGLPDQPDNLDESKAPQPQPIYRQVDPVPMAFLVVGLFLGSLLGVWVRTHNWLSAEPPSKFTELAQWTQALNDPQSATIARRLFELEHPYTPYATDIYWRALDATPDITATHVLSAEVAMWETLGLDRQTVVRELFALKYTVHDELLTAAAPNPESGPDTPSRSTDSVLFDNRQATQTECGNLAKVPTQTKLKEELSKSENQVFKALSEAIDDPDVLRKAVDKLCGLI